MSDDLIEDAIDCLRGEGWDNEADAVDRSVAEIKRLRDERHAILGVKTKEGLTASEWVLRTGLAERQLVAKDARIAELEQIAIDLKAVSYFVNFQAREQVFGLQPKEIQDKYRDRAAKELNLQVAQEAGYVDRLEEAFVEEVTDALWMAGADHPHEKAIAALTKIREEPTC